MHEKFALITGASEGIGRAFARALSQEGFTLTLVARNRERLSSLLDELSKPRHRLIVANLETLEGIQTVSNELRRQHYDLLINNAGFGAYGEFSLTPLEKNLSVLKVNVEALLSLSCAFLQKAKTGDALLNLSSTLAFTPMAGSSVYSATKAFVTSFSESLWAEERARGVYVLNLCPGITATEFHHRSGGTSQNSPPQFLTQTPDEVVETALKALARRRHPTIISGLSNRLFAFLTRFLSRRSVAYVMGLMAVQQRKSR